jgi:hopanoid biosynthesis associated protein HpnK
VNEAVELGHRNGILSAASLMVAGPAAADAMARARAMPRLAVGLHLALTDARPALEPEQIPDLVDDSGRLRSNLARLGAALAVRRNLRAQMRAEIEAQFSLYQASGLPLDHVNVHQHFHLHPMVAAMVIDIGRRYGMTALRVPREPRRILGELGNSTPRRSTERFCAAILHRRSRRAGLDVPDAVFGLRWSGAMTAARLRHLLEWLPPGVSEIYLHPATSDRFPGHAPGYRYRDELAALTDNSCAANLQRNGLRPGGYRDIPSSSRLPVGDELCRGDEDRGLTAEHRQRVGGIAHPLRQ